MKALHGLLCLPLSMVWACPGAAQPYPSRPIELVSPTGAGGGSEGHVVRQAVGHNDVVGRVGPLVGEVQGVGQRGSHGDGVGRIRLGEQQVGDCDSADNYGLVAVGVIGGIGVTATGHSRCVGDA